MLQDYITLSLQVAMMQLAVGEFARDLESRSAQDLSKILTRNSRAGICLTADSIARARAELAAQQESEINAFRGQQAKEFLG